MLNKMATSWKKILVGNRGMLINSLYGMYEGDAVRECRQKKVKLHGDYWEALERTCVGR